MTDTWGKCAQIVWRERCCGSVLVISSYSRSMHSISAGTAGAAGVAAADSSSEAEASVASSPSSAAAGFGAAEPPPPSPSSSERSTRSTSSLFSFFSSSFFFFFLASSSSLGTGCQVPSWKYYNQLPFLKIVRYDNLLARMTRTLRSYDWFERFVSGVFYFQTKICREGQNLW